MTQTAYEIVNGWIVQQVDGCTCYGGNLPEGHEPGCGWEALVQVVDALAETNACHDNVVSVEKYHDALNALGAIDELTVADRPYHWRLEHIHEIAKVAKAGGSS